MRDWTKYRVFEMADRLVVKIYQESRSWPKEQIYGLTSQIQRAAVSVASNIVEGCSRQSDREFCRYIEIAYASACEVQYQLSVASRVFSDNWEERQASIEQLEGDATALSKALGAFLRGLSSGPKARGQEPEA